MTTTPTAIAPYNGAAIIETVIAKGDLALLTAEQRVSYYREVCRSLDLNELTRPFEYIPLNGKLTLYARKDCTDQLRDKRSVSITRIEREQIGDLFVVTAYAQRGDRQDSEIGAVNIAGVRGEALANAMMKAVTKAKRRVTLSICGLGVLDESEVDSIPVAREDLPSLAGDAVIEAEYTPFRERDVQDAPPKTKPSADTVTSDDDRLWKRWLSLRDEGLGLGLIVADLTLPIARTLLTSLGLRLAAEIEARKKKLATEDAARAAGKAAHEDSATGRSPVTPEGRGEESPPSSPRRLSRAELWRDNRTLSDRASDLKLTTRTVPQRATDEEITAENERLSALIRAHEAGSNASPAPEQVAAF